MNHFDFKTKRVNLKLSQSQLAAEMNYSLISIKFFETGRRRITDRVERALNSVLPPHLRKYRAYIHQMKWQPEPTEREKADKDSKEQEKPTMTPAIWQDKE